MVRRIVSILAVGLASSAAALAACLDAGDSSPPPTGAPDATASDAPVTPLDGALPDAGPLPSDDLGELGAFCTQYAAGDCARQRHCWNAPFPDCEIGVETACRMYMRAEIKPAVTAGLVTFDSAQAAKCLATPMDDYCLGNNYWSLVDCQNVFRGTVANGDKCFSLYFYDTVSECKEGACTQHEQIGACTAGTCVPWIGEGAR